MKYKDIKEGDVIPLFQDKFAMSIDDYKDELEELDSAFKHKVEDFNGPTETLFAAKKEFNKGRKEYVKGMEEAAAQLAHQKELDVRIEDAIYDAWAIMHAGLNMLK